MTRLGPAVVQRGAQVPDAPLVTVCLLVLDDPRLAVACLDSLAASDHADRLEIVVVANGTRPEPRAVLEARADITLISSRVNLGFAAGNNLAAGVARGRYLFLINDDSSIEPDCIARLVATAESDPAIGAVGGRIDNADGTIQEAGSVLWSDGWASHVGLGLRDTRAAFHYVRDVDYTSANGLLVRVDAWRNVGGLDESYFPAYFEDVDFCMALRQHGYRVVFEPRAGLTHLESQSTSKRYRNFLLSRNRDRFRVRWAARLEQLDPRPRADDRPAVERAVHRARGRPPRLVVLPAEEPAGSDRDDLAGLLAYLARVGWAVTVVTGSRAERWPFRSCPGPAAIDRLIDLGVDLRTEELAETMRLLDFDVEALIVPAGARSAYLPVFRPDNTVIPVVAMIDPRQTDSRRRTHRAVSELARRRPTEAPLSDSRDDRYPATVERRRAEGSGDGALDDDGNVGGAVDDGTVETALAQKELDAARAELAVKAEYIAALEAALDTKTSYIESLPSARLKAWVSSLISRP